MSELTSSRRGFRLITWILIPLASGCASALRQVPDLSFEPSLPRPAFEGGQGPRVLIDEAHHNFHTVGGRFAPFAELLRRDGYVVAPIDSTFSSETLAQADILVIANPIAEQNREKWKLPTPSAFTGDEIAAVREWVEGGGSLFLIADHMPFPGAAAELAAAFGVLFGNGFVVDADGDGDLTFKRDAGTLADHPITRGRDEADRVDDVRTFMGQGFRAETPVEPLLVLASGTTMLLPVKAWKFSDRTPSVPASGMFQGAVLRHGKGRVAVFGEAAMFSAQQVERGDEVVSKMGMNTPEAAENPQFLLNVVHWLSGVLPD